MNVDRTKIAFGSKKKLMRYDCGMGFFLPILSTHKGKVKFIDIIEEQSMLVQTDDNTGISNVRL